LKERQIAPETVISKEWALRRLGHATLVGLCMGLWRSSISVFEAMCQVSIARKRISTAKLIGTAVPLVEGGALASSVPETTGPAVAVTDQEDSLPADVTGAGYALKVAAALGIERQKANHERLGTDLQVGCSLLVPLWGFSAEEAKQNWWKIGYEVCDFHGKRIKAVLDYNIAMAMNPRPLEPEKEPVAFVTVAVEDEDWARQQDQHYARHTINVTKGLNTSVHEKTSGGLHVRGGWSEHGASIDTFLVVHAAPTCEDVSRALKTFEDDEGGHKMAIHKMTGCTVKYVHLTRRMDGKPSTPKRRAASHDQGTAKRARHPYERREEAKHLDRAGHEP